MKAIVISDIHFGHHKNKTENIVQELKSFLQSIKPYLKEAGYIIIPGDVFDRLLPFGSDDSVLIANFFRWLDGFADSFELKVIVLNGTVSHDYFQNRLLKHYFVKTPFLFVDSMAIHNVDGLNVLFIPDDLPQTHIKQQEMVLKLMQEKGIEKLDMAIMHGMFKHHIDIASVPSFDDDFFLDIVKHYIIIGHNHTHKVFKRIITPGSFSRLVHGEEEPKGGLYIEVCEPMGDRYVFLENKNAMIFKTVNMIGEHVTIDNVWKEVKKYKRGSYIRVKADRSNLDRNMQYDIINKFKDYHMSFDFEKKIKENEEARLTAVTAKVDISPALLREKLLEELPRASKVTLKEINLVFDKYAV